MGIETFAKTAYHEFSDYSALTKAGVTAYKQVAKYTYTFENFFHPFVDAVIERLNTRSLPGIFDAKFQTSLKAPLPASFYKPKTDQVSVKFFDKDIDVTIGGPYANYNWEFFFHLPLAIATHLSKTQRFAEAQRWFHFIFDPTENESADPAPDRYWKFKAFRAGGGGRQIDELLALLSKPASECTSDELLLKKTVLTGYRAVQNNPFQPHVVARTRPLAYMYSVVMRYLDNLIAWGDHLFRQDTLETINEATQLYVLASNLLGQRPEKVPLKGRTKPKTFAELKASGIDAMGNALVELEGLFPLNIGLPGGSPAPAGSAPLFGLGRTLYFCIPRNERMLGYWDTVEDRLFKIRHCMNLQGVVRPLALFDPPIDPGMLVKAAAAGLDIGAIVAGLNQPASTIRAHVLIQKALELCGEVRGLGSALLQAIEKGDAEQLALLRQGHEIKIQQLQQDVRFLQWKQAEQNTEVLLRTRGAMLERYRYYLRLLGQVPDGAQVPNPLALDRQPITEENFEVRYAALVGAYGVAPGAQRFAALSMKDGAAPTTASGAQGTGALGLISHEGVEEDKTATARDLGLAASITEAVGSALAFIPDAKGNLHFWGLGGTIDIKVGTAIQKGVEIAARIMQMTAAYNREEAAKAARTASHIRRADDWLLQANLAAHDLQQVGRQLIASLISEQAAHREYETLATQIEQSQAAEDFLKAKFSNTDLYGWMQGELSRLHYEYYRFAFDVARRAEQTMKRELMRPELDEQTLINFNYWDGGRRGLLAGEALNLDVKRMELAYHEYNLREYELTKSVSLLQLDPSALISLRSTGRCTVQITESLLDQDGAGQHLRRLRDVALSIPCVVGPFTNINCKLTQIRSSIRTSSALDGDYERQGAEDPRFQDFYGGIRSVIVSTAQQDSGLFEPHVRDEHYFPFENTGVISEWRLELPANPAEEPTQFDYATISDVILHLRYTAREGGERLRAAAKTALDQLIQDAAAAGMVRLFSLRHEFPVEWARFTNQKPGPNQRYELKFELRPEHYPYWSRNLLKTVARIDLFGQAEGGVSSIDLADRSDKTDGGTIKDPLTKVPALGGLLVGRFENLPLPVSPAGEVTLFLDDNKLEDLWLAVNWGS